MRRAVRKRAYGTALPCNGAFRVQAIRNNPEAMPKSLDLRQNLITNYGKVSLQDALEDAYQNLDLEIVIEM